MALSNDTLKTAKFDDFTKPGLLNKSEFESLYATSQKNKTERRDCQS